MSEELINKTMVETISFKYVVSMKNLFKFKNMHIPLIMLLMLSLGCKKEDSSSDSESNATSPSQRDQAQPPKERLEVYIDGVSTSDRIRKIRNDNKTVVYSALEKLEEGQRIEVVEDVESQCDGTPAKYLISKENGELNLTLDIKFMPENETNEYEFQRGIEKVESCLPEIEEFFLRYDVKFNLNIYTSEPSQNIKTLNKVKITAKNVRSNVGLYSTASNLFCTMVLHEMGHLFGLADEYHEPGTCRTSEHASKDHYPWSLMDGISADQEFEIFPRHFKTLLAAVYDEKGIIIRDENGLQEPKRFILTLSKDLVPTRKGLGWATIDLLSNSGNFTGRMTLSARSRKALIDIVPAGTKLVFKNAKETSIARRIRKHDGSLDTRTRYLVNFNDGFKTREDIYLHSFGTDYYSNSSKIKGLHEALEEFGKLEWR